MKNDPVTFTAKIQRITSKIDTVGDKVASLVLEFYATDENLAAIGRLQQPDSYATVTINTNSE